MGSNSEVKLNGGRSWLQFLVTFVMGITVAMGMFKVPTNFPNICSFFGVEMSTAVWLMSVVGLACIVTAIPAGAIMQKFGVKKFAYVCMAAAIIENVVGYFATDFNVLLATRFLEAISYGCISMVSAAIIAGGFSPEKRGLPNGVWVLWVSLANMIVPQITTLVSPSMGFQGVWLVIGVAQIVMLVIFALVVKEPAAVEPENKEEKGSIFDGLKEPGVWCISLFTLGLAIGCGCFTGLFPSFLQSPAVGFDMATANNIVSIANIGGIVACLVTGFIINLVAPRNRGILAIVIAIISIICFAMQYHLPANIGILTAFGIFFAAVSNLNMPLAFAWLPDILKRPETLNMSLGVLMIGANLGGALSLNIPTILIENAGGVWGAADPFIIGFAVLGLAAAIGGHLFMKKLAKSKQS